MSAANWGKLVNFEAASRKPNLKAFGYFSPNDNLGFIAGGVTTGNSVVDYGAVGDGITDDTQAFIDCLADNALVVIPSGTYLITSTITIPGKTRMIGAYGLYPLSSAAVGRQAILLGNFAGPILYTHDGGCVLSDFVVNGGNVAGSTGISIGANVSSYFTAMVEVSRVGVIRCGNNVEVQNAFAVAFHNLKSLSSLGHGLWVHPPTTYPGGRPTIAANPPAGGETTTILVDSQSEFDSNAGSGCYFDGFNNDVTIVDSIFDNNLLTDVNFVGTGRSVRFERNYIESVAPVSLNIAAGYGFTGYDYDPTGAIFIGKNFVQGVEEYNGNTIIRLGETGSSTSTNTNYIPTLVAELEDSSTIGVLGATIIVNGSFTGSATGWGLQTGWTYASDHAVATAVDAFAACFQGSLSITQGSWYKVQYTLTVAAGQVRASFASALTAFRTVSGTYTEYMQATAPTGSVAIYFQGINGFTGTLDDVSVQLITPTGVEHV